MKKTGHLNQCDLASLIPLELFLSAKLWPQITTNETYLLNSQLVIDFMNRQGFGSGHGDPKAVRSFIEAMREEWLDYDIRCSAEGPKKL